MANGVEFRAAQDSNPTICSIQTPGRFRIDYPGDTGHFVLRGAESWTRVGTRSVESTAADLKRTQHMHALVQGLLLLPLYDAPGVKHLDNGRLEVTTPSSVTWTLHYDPTTLAAQVMTGPDGTVTIHEQHDSDTMFMPIRVTIGDLQDQLTRIKASDVQFKAATFQRPEERDKPKQTISFQKDDQPMTPQFQWIAASHLLRMEAPDDWASIKKMSVSAARPPKTRTSCSDALALGSSVAQPSAGSQQN